ncbi:HNH endonuclease [Mycolicibacterium sp. CBMA 334]|uniref:HNH endonuclease n=1 Tax=Mycolicibacterium sp. CBMA 334 TaxID=2606607 RepID=UPI0012DD6EA4|nr:HNH endonuclease [Mycolicibacterium sp. CBMA 334]MUM01342.1 HNH endonuclease [Mycolicibacterium sp. CBMA 334]
MTMFLPAPAVEVFNADYSPLDRVDMQAAVSMLMRSTAIEVPKSLMLVRYAPVPYRRDRDAASRTEILRRDDHLCQFAGCGAQATTIDHVFPRSRGGSVSSWTNQVAACEPCNNRKAHHTPEEAGMRLLREPFRPAHV